jgi:hypothetical protein
MNTEANRYVSRSHALEEWNINFNLIHLRILVGCTMETLHDFGVTHGGLVYPADLRHLILDVDAPGLSRDDVLGGKARCYVVDFADARVGHNCARRLPVLPLDAFLTSREVGCSESEKVTYLLGFMKTSPLIKRAFLLHFVAYILIGVMQYPPIARLTRPFNGTTNTPSTFLTFPARMC